MDAVMDQLECGDDIIGLCVYTERNYSKLDSNNWSDECENIFNLSNFILFA